MIYLNQAATTYPKPQCVLDAHTASFSAQPAGQFRSSAAEVDILEKCRRHLGTLLGIEEYDRIFFSSGATDSANALIYGLPLKGRNVVATQTEHNSILRPLMNLKEQVGSVTIVPCNADGRVEPQMVEKAITKETAAVFVNHCSNVTGMVQDIRAISEITKRKGIYLVVDASQSAGCIPLQADRWGIDILIFTGHKGLFGAQGTGGYYVRRAVSLTPYRYGGTGRDSSRLTYEDGAYEYETGTQNAPGLAALCAGVEYVLGRGVENIADKERRMMKALYAGLQEIPGIRLYGSAQSNQGPVMSFTCEGLAPSDIGYILQNGYGITVRTGLHCAPLIHEAMGTCRQGTVRVSISDLTKEADVQALLEAMREICSAAEAGL